MSVDLNITCPAALKIQTDARMVAEAKAKEASQITKANNKLAGKVLKPRGCRGVITKQRPNGTWVYGYNLQEAMGLGNKRKKVGSKSDWRDYNIIMVSNEVCFGIQFKLPHANFIWPLFVPSFHVATSTEDVIGQHSQTLLGGRFEFGCDHNRTITWGRPRFQII